MGAQGFRSVDTQKHYNVETNLKNRIIMSHRCLLLIAFLILPSISFARLGETEEKNQSRYGQPVKNIHDTTAPILKRARNKTYHYQGWQIRIGYVNGHAVRMFY
jgi:hypothetical protein